MRKRSAPGSFYARLIGDKAAALRLGQYAAELEAMAEPN
jgi:hypothetical protein